MTAEEGKMAYLNWVRACWQCDGCGKNFVVEIDPGWKPPAEWDIDDIAKDAVRGGEVVEMTKHGTIKFGIVGSSSIQHDMVLCRDCTRIADGIGDDDYRPSKDEILRELGSRS
jgi:hypothetical protein